MNGLDLDKLYMMLKAHELLLGHPKLSALRTFLEEELLKLLPQMPAMPPEPDPGPPKLPGLDP